MSTPTDGLLGDVPEEVQYGRVVLTAVAFLADGVDAGERPDEAALGGTVTLTPLPSLVRWPTTQPPRLSSLVSLECPVIGGALYPPGTTEDTLPAEAGVSVVATEQPHAEPDRIAWFAGFELTYRGRPIPQPPTMPVEVPAGAAVDLAHVIPTPPAPGVVHVVTSADRLAAQAAAARAQDSASTAAGHAASAASSATASSASEASAATSAHEAGLAHLAAEAARDTAAESAHTATVQATDATDAAHASSVSATTATGAADDAGGSATAAAGSATTAATHAQTAATAATSAATSRDVAQDAATTATTAQADAAASATAAAESAQTAVEAAESVHGFRIFLVPYDEWPPAPDPSPLTWYVRVWPEEAP